MKKHILLCFVLGIVCFSTADSQTTLSEPESVLTQYGNMPNEFDNIELMGSLMLGVGPNAIEAGASDDAVYIGFNQSFGNVNIAIYNSNGQQVYSTVVDTSIQQVVIIPFTTAAADTYTVELSHADDYAEGDFEKN